MIIRIARNENTPIYQQIGRQLQAMITGGELPPGSKLLPERRLAQMLDVSRGTVSRVYAELCADGLVEARQGDGYRVVFQPLEQTRLQSRQRVILSNPWNYFETNQGTGLRLEEEPGGCPAGRIPLADCVPDPRAAPVEEIRRLAEHLLSERPDEAFGSAPPQGLAALRSSTASLLAATRFLCATAQNIQIVSDTKVVLDHLLRMYIREGDAVVVPEPVCPETCHLMRLCGAKLLTVPMDEAGLRLDILEPLLDRYAPKLIYVMPDFHNPTGTTMPYGRRVQLLELSYHYGVPIIEENPLPALRYTGTMITPLKALDRHGYVIYLGSHSHILGPGLRSAFAVADERIIRSLTRMSAVTTGQGGALGQLLLAEMIDSGFYLSHLERIRLLYKERWRRALALLHRRGGQLLDWVEPAGGLSLWCRLPGGVGEGELLARCRQRGVELTGGSRFFPHGTDGSSHIRLSFCTTADAVEQGIALLLDELEALLGEGA